VQQQMNSLGTLTVTQMLEAFSSSEPLPAGAAAAALAGAVGASLLAKIAAIARHEGDAIEALLTARSHLLTLADEDSRAYAAVLAALRMPKATLAETEERRTRLARAMRTATDVPLAALRACRDGLRVAPAVAKAAPASTTADVSVALELLRAAVRGLAGSVDANIPALRDPAFAEQVRAERVALEAECRGMLDRSVRLSTAP
jgi:formiminotetrahydrofolate cyclodeaminase